MGDEAQQIGAKRNEGSGLGPYAVAASWTLVAVRGGSLGYSWATAACLTSRGDDPRLVASGPGTGLCAWFTLPVTL